VIAKGVADSSQHQHPAKHRDRQNALRRKREKRGGWRLQWLWL